MEALSTLTAAEREELVKAEFTIETKLKAFWEVGSALAKVRDKTLYRETHGTFEDYCRARWNLDHNHARRLVHAAETRENLKSMPIGILPESESQVRPLTALKEPGQQQEAWEVALESSPTGKPTAREVKAAVETVKQKTAPAEPEKPVSEKLPPYIPSNGLEYAFMAISQLEKIQPQDTQRGKAFAKVRAWLDKQPA